MQTGRGRATVGRKAFTLTEVLVSVLVLTIALLGVAAAISFGMDAGEHARKITEAEGYAREILEYVSTNSLAWTTTVTAPPASSGVNDAAGATQALGAAPLSNSGISFPTDTPYKRHIEVTSSVATTDSGYTGWKLDVRQISVTVSWLERGSSRSVVLKTFQRRPL